MATDSERLEEARMDHHPWTSERWEVRRAKARKKVKANQISLKLAKLAEKNTQENVGIPSKGLRTKKKAKENPTKKERIKKEKERKEKVRAKNAPYVRKRTPPRTAGTMPRPRIPHQEKVIKMARAARQQQ